MGRGLCVCVEVLLSCWKPSGCSMDRVRHWECSERTEACVPSLVCWRVKFGAKVSLKMTEDVFEEEQTPGKMGSAWASLPFCSSPSVWERKVFWLWSAFLPSLPSLRFWAWVNLASSVSSNFCAREAFCFLCYAQKFPLFIFSPWRCPSCCAFVPTLWV